MRADKSSYISCRAWWDPTTNGYHGVVLDWATLLYRTTECFSDPLIATEAAGQWADQQDLYITAQKW